MTKIKLFHKKDHPLTKVYYRNDAQSNLTIFDWMYCKKCDEFFRILSGQIMVKVKKS